MKKINFAIVILKLNFVYWLIYNTYFGWNMIAQSELETSFDNVFKLAINIGLIIYFLPLLDMYERFIKKNERKS